jgi:hypothetical protein
VKGEEIWLPILATPVIVVVMCLLDWMGCCQ